MTALHPVLARVTDRIVERSRRSRRRYLDLMIEQKERGISRPRLSCGNFAHGFAAAGEDKEAIKRLAAAGKPFTSDVLVAEVGMPGHYNAVGARMNAAARKGIIHDRNASRRKGRLMAAFAAAQAAKSATA